MIRETGTSLTPTQKDFAEKHHGLLIAFISRYHLDMPEYYGPLAERYLVTVKRYLENSNLNRYAFSTILWYRLRGELSHIMRSQPARPPTICFSDADFPYRDDLNEVETQELIEHLTDALTKKELQVFSLRKFGLSYKAIAKQCGCSENAVKCRFKRIKKRISGSKIFEL